MIRVYEWKNELGEIRTTSEHDTPPDSNHAWRRVYSFGVGRVSGAGASPNKPSTTLSKNESSRT